VFEHLEEREGGDVDLLGGVEQRRVAPRLPHPGLAEDPLQPLHGFAFAAFGSLLAAVAAHTRVPGGRCCAAQSEAGVFLSREKLGRGMLCEGTGLRYPLCKSWAEISYLEELGCGALLADGMRIALPQFYFFRVFDFPIQNILKIQCVFVSEQLYFHVIQLYDH
jgi:hypothetical protein